MDKWKWKMIYYIAVAVWVLFLVSVCCVTVMA